MPVKVFISQPMSGLSYADVLDDRERVSAKVARWAGGTDNVDIVPMLEPKDQLGNHPLYNLGSSLQLLSEADLCVLAEGWEEARGCIIERAACYSYGIPYMRESDI